MGLRDQMEQLIAPYDQYAALTSSGDELQSMSLQVFAPYGITGLLQRKELMQVLTDGAKQRGIDMKYNLMVEMIEESGENVTVTFSDGSTDVYDLVVGADGIHSTVRRIVFGDLPLNFSGFVGYAWWLDASDLCTVEGIKEYWGAAKFFGVYPSKDAVCVFCGFHGPEQTPVPVEERIEHVVSTFSEFKGIVPDILTGLKLRGKPEELYYCDYSDIRMEQWHKGRVVLIGDACHAFLPSAGIGASMALESATVLAEELSRTDAKRVQNAFRLYYKRRKTRCDKAQTDSRRLLKMMFLSNPILTWARDKLIKSISFETLMGGIIKLHKEPI
ncbi:FAD-dependent urate hydroxylase-like isoform X2 [Corticium candelabrum]|nr:FAD-dependent urate hydroxylase-like isoform X2 [Corticium candelabrum]